MADDDGSPSDPAGTDKSGSAKDGGGHAEERAEGQAAGPLDEDQAIRSLRGESEQWREDIARSMQILDSLRSRMPADLISAGTVNVFNAGVNVAGNFTTGAGSSRTVGTDGAPVPFDAEHFRDYLTGYVQPDGFGNALDILRREHLLIVAARGGTGMQTTPLALLATVLPEDPATGVAPVFELGTALLGDHQWQVPASPSSSGRGYVVTATAEPDYGHTPAHDRMDDAWLTHTRGVLRESGAYLVVVIRQVGGKLAEATHRPALVVEDLTAPPPEAIIRSKVLALDPTVDLDEIDGWLADPDTVQMLAERPQPRFATRYATTILRALEQGDDVAAELRTLRDTAELVREWFDDHSEAEQTSLAIATAFLEESSFLTVSDAGASLYLRMTHRTTGPSPSLRYRRDLSASNSWIELAAPEGGEQRAAAILRFRTSDVRFAVLGYAWTELDGIRAELLTWLREQAAHSDIEVRARAAQSAGVLAIADFQHALNSYIREWAASDHTSLRSSAATVLDVVGDAPHLTRRVWTLLRQWRAHPSHQLRATAAMVAGGPLGVAEPRRALRLLHGLLDVEDDWVLLEPVALSVMRLLVTVDPGLVIDSLLDWSEPDENPAPVVKALVIFTVAVRQPEVLAPGQDEEDSGDHRPLLLTRARGFERELPELWGRALADDSVNATALDALREWVRIADEDDEAYHTVLYLLASLADRSERDAERVEYHLERWANDEDESLPAAKPMLAALLEVS